MPRGSSGRVVIEMDPQLKRELHSALVADGRTLKDWFIAQAEAFLEERRQPSLPGLLKFPQNQEESNLKVAEDPVPYRVTPKSPDANTPKPTETENE